MNRRSVLLAGAAASLLLAGCATPQRPAAGLAQWSGRMALQVPGDARQSFTARFDLRGSAREGELELFTPLGSTAALLQWTPGQASLRAPGQPLQLAASLEALVLQALGTAVPVAALFDWLAGTPTPAADWQADLSERGQGRLRARQLTPPAADLRVVLETP